MYRKALQFKTLKAALNHICYEHYECWGCPLNDDEAANCIADSYLQATTDCEKLTGKRLVEKRLLELGWEVIEDV